MFMQSSLTIKQDENKLCDSHMVYFRDAAQTLKLSVCSGLIHQTIKGVDLKKVM